MTAFEQFWVFLLATAFVQNLVLTTGFGSSVMLRIVRRPGVPHRLFAADGAHRLPA